MQASALSYNGRRKDFAAATVRECLACSEDSEATLFDMRELGCTDESFRGSAVLGDNAVVEAVARYTQLIDHQLH